MKRIVTTVTMFLLCVQETASAQFSKELKLLLSACEDRAVSDADFARRISDLGASGDLVDADAWRGILFKLTSEESSPAVRARLFRLAIERATPRIVPDILDFANDCLARLAVRSSADGAAKDDCAWECRVLAQLAVTDLTRLQPSQPEAERLLKTLTEAVRSGCLPLGATEKCWSQIARTAASPESRSKAAVTVISSMPQSTQAPAVLLSLLDVRDFDALRSVLQTSVNAGSVNLAAAAALSHFGDSASVPILMAARDMLRARQSKLLRYVEHDLWMVEVQTPPEKLLEFLSDGDIRLVDTRIWAMNRCIERGVARNKARAALDRHLLRVQSTTGEMRKLASIKREAIKLALMCNADWPSVPTEVLDAVP